MWQAHTLVSAEIFERKQITQLTKTECFSITASTLFPTYSDPQHPVPALTHKYNKHQQENNTVPTCSPESRPQEHYRATPGLPTDER
jgi:hypothetical protein